MKMKQWWLMLSLLASFFLVACKDTDEYTVDPRTNFEALWKILDENYCFFDYKQVDWDEVHDRYSAQLTDTMNQFALFDLMGEMLAELKDGHTNLYSSFDVARYWDWYQDYPPNFYDDLNELYLGKDYKIAGGLKYKKMHNDQIGYIRYASFSSGIGETNLDYVLYHFKDCKALIIDVRDNGGGVLTYSDRFASRFTEEQVLKGYIQHKTGKGHQDFSEPYPVYLEPTSYICWLRPVVVLTNRYCYSAANDFVQTMRIFPQVTIKETDGIRNRSGHTGRDNRRRFSTRCGYDYRKCYSVFARNYRQRPIIGSKFGGKICFYRKKHYFCNRFQAAVV